MFSTHHGQEGQQPHQQQQQQGGGAPPQQQHQQQQPGYGAPQPGYPYPYYAPGYPVPPQQQQAPAQAYYGQPVFYPQQQGYGAFPPQRPLLYPEPQRLEAGIVLGDSSNTTTASSAEEGWVEFPNENAAATDSPPPHEKPATVQTVQPYDPPGRTDPPLLVVFVNTKSGGNQGKELLPIFKELLPEEQVIDLLNEKPVGPDNAIKRFAGRPGLRLLACGGDGTGKWVLEVLDKMGVDPNPPVGVLPLGTGNDIGRVLGWGAGYERGQSIPVILDDVCHAVPLLLDRWRIKIDSDKASGDAKHESHVLNNYLCIGFADAQVALEFHNNREQNPGLYFNRGVNKLWYAHYGLKTTLMSTVSPPGNLVELLEITIDGQQTELQAGIQGIVVLNLPSYAGGMNMWGTARDHRYKMVSMNDGLIEVIGVYSPVHLARISAGLATAVRIGQGKDIKIKFRPTGPENLPCKIDGEPWLQTEPCTFHITFFKQSWMLCRAHSAASVTQPEKTGWADKQGAKVRNWRKRYFVLKDQKLYYFATTQDREPKGCIDIKEAKASVAASLFNLRPNMIQIDTGSGRRTFYMSFDNLEEADSWVAAINASSSAGASAPSDAGAQGGHTFFSALGRASPFHRRDT